MHKSPSESIFLVDWFYCVVVVYILDSGVKNFGNVSINVGLEFVSNGFIYLKNIQSELYYLY